MNTNSKTIHLFIFSLLFTTIGFAQNLGIEFKYDDAGNRYLRRVINLPTEKISESNEAGTSNYNKISDTSTYKYTEILGKVEFNIYPNPNGGRFKVAIINKPENSKASIYMQSILGAELFQIKDIQEITEVDIRNRENGAYILILELDGEVKTWKVIKQ